MKVTPEKSPEYHLQIFSCLSASFPHPGNAGTCDSLKTNKETTKIWFKANKGSTADILHSFALKILVQEMRERKETELLNRQ